MAKTSGRTTALTQQVLQHLKSGGLQKQHLTEAVKFLTALDREGIRPVKVFPIGIPVPDAIEIHSILNAATVGALLKLLKDLPRIDVIRIFPKGIPRPDVFLAEITMR